VVGFEPTAGFRPATVFKTVALIHSATPPYGYREGITLIPPISLRSRALYGKLTATYFASIARRMFSSSRDICTRFPEISRNHRSEAS
jgi:hypothetical protein